MEREEVIIERNYSGGKGSGFGVQARSVTHSEYRHLVEQRGSEAPGFSLNPDP
jgi:hypothetical protein